MGRLSTFIAAVIVAGSVASPTDQCPDAVLPPTCSGPTSAEEYLSLVADPSIYDKSKRPPCKDGQRVGPTVVEVQMKLRQLNDVDMKVGTMVLAGYLRLWWFDPRLAFNGTSDGGCMNVISIPESTAAPVWMPDIYVDNLVSREVDGMSTLTQIQPDGSVWRSEQTLLTVKVPFNLGKLPFDSHRGWVTLASYSQDITQLRLVPRGGTIGAPSSGVAIDGSPMKSSVWDFHLNGGDVEEVGFKNPGKVQVLDNWDYVDLTFAFSRKPKFFISQVILPCTLFLLVSYIQFFVDSSAAPARAALAVIPVLIMRTMSNSIYESIAQGSQYMWLDDFVTTSMFLCVFAAMHFGVVQYFRLLEKAREAKLKGLVKSKEISAKLSEIARDEDTTLLELLTRFRPVTRELGHEEMQRHATRMQREGAAMFVMATDDSASPQGAAGEAADGPTVTVDAAEPAQTSALPEGSSKSNEMRVSSEEARKLNIRESDLLFIMYTRDVFLKYDRNGDNSMSPEEIRLMLGNFNIYMSTSEVMKTICQFLRDSGFPTPVNEEEIRMKFSDFVAFLLRIDEYTLRRAVGVLKVKAYFQSIPPSTKWDVVARFAFPVLIAMQFLAFFLLREVY